MSSKSISGCLCSMASVSNTTKMTTLLLLGLMRHPIWAKRDRCSSHTWSSSWRKGTLMSIIRLTLRLMLCKLETISRKLFHSLPTSPCLPSLVILRCRNTRLIFKVSSMQSTLAPCVSTVVLQTPWSRKTSIPRTCRMGKQSTPSEAIKESTSIQLLTFTTN